MGGPGGANCLTRNDKVGRAAGRVVPVPGLTARPQTC